MADASSLSSFSESSIGSLCSSELLYAAVKKLQRPKMTIFASQEAESAARDALSKGDLTMEEMMEDTSTSDRKECIGMDIQLTESPRFVREKKSAAATRNWRKATISAKLCVSDFGKKKLTMNSCETDAEISQQSNGESPNTNEKSAASSTFNRRRWRRVGLCAAANVALISNTLSSASKDNETSVADIDTSSDSGVKSSSTAAIPVISHYQRFGRRLSHHQPLSRSLPDRIQPPSPPKNPMTRSQSDNLEMLRFRRRPSTTTTTRRISCSQSTGLPSPTHSPPSSSCSSPTLNRRRRRSVSLTSDLQTNRTVVGELLQERSEVISQLSQHGQGQETRSATSRVHPTLNGHKSHMIRTTAWDESKQIPASTPKSSTTAHEVPSVSLSAPTKIEKPIGNAKEENVELVQYFDVRSSDASSATSIVYPIKNSELYDDNSSCCGSERSYNSTSRPVSRRSACSASSSESLPMRARTSSVSSCSSAASRTSSSSSLMTGLRRNSVARLQLPSVVTPRTDAEIVKDVEDEIQHRISVRKHQLLQRAGGLEQHGRLQERALARSPAGQLRKVLSDLNQKRTTSELWQIAVEKNRLQKQGMGQMIAPAR